MSLSSKNLATFLLGVAAGAAALKYATMSEEEKEKLTASLKEKANKMKDDAEASMEKTKDYFSELGQKGSAFLKEHWADADNFLKDLFNKKQSATNDPVDSN